MDIRQMTDDDAHRVLEIYAEGIATGNATFETEVPDWEAWDQGHDPNCRLVAVEEGAVVGWAALSPASDRCCYAGVAETSVYISPAVWGQGVGVALLNALVGQSEKEGYWTLLAEVLKENMASIRLHEKSGFRQVGVNERIGQMHGQWRDVVRLEHRSSVVGV
jgi:L-amino acid N-acyltransferase YncA